MIPSVRSRLWASAFAFALGFGIANYGVIMVVRPDQWVWLGVAAVLMLTGAVGVLVSDSRRRLSMWAVVGVELLVLFTLLPLLWVVALAIDPGGSTLWPGQLSWDAFSDAAGSAELRRAAATSALVALLATVVSVPLAAGAAYALVRRRVRGRRPVYVLVLAVLLAPTVVFTVPVFDQLLAWDLLGERLVLAVPMLLLTLPLATWLCVGLLGQVPWSLADALRADGGTRRQLLRRFALPMVVPPGLAVIAAVVFVVACQDLVLGLGLTGDDAPLTATLLRHGDQLGTSVVAAAGVLWMLPGLLLVLVFPRRVTALLGRSYR